jgi:ribosome maturation factor RimP
MLNKNEIEKLAISALENESDLFVVEVKVSSTNKITLLIDSLRGLTIQDCVKTSRALEALIDREKEDFELEVSSPGAESAFRVFNQYVKHINRDVKIMLNDGTTYEGILKTAGPDEVSLEKYPSKKKRTESNSPAEIIIPMKDIRLAQGIIKF